MSEEELLARATYLLRSLKDYKLPRSRGVNVILAIKVLVAILLLEFEPTR